MSPSIASSEDDLETAGSNSKGPSGSQTGNRERIGSMQSSLAGHWTQDFGLGESISRGMPDLLNHLDSGEKGHLFTY